MKQKFTVEIAQKFENSKTHIEDLEKVIDENTKLIKDLTETMQTKNTEVKTLKSEDLVKQAQIDSLQKKNETL